MSEDKHSEGILEPVEAALENSKPPKQQKKT